MRKEVILETIGLWSGYGGKPVLQGVDVRVRESEIVAVIGRNGVGKSTLMKAIIGLLPTQQGSVLFRAGGVDTLPAHKRARLGIGYVPQGRDVFPRMSVLDNLAVGESIGMAGSGRKLEEIFTYFPILNERRNQPAGTMSGGQQQQLAIGRALMGGPSLMLLDEPSEGIQPNIVQDIAKLMVALNKSSGLTIIIVEQNIDMIRAMAQRCYVMDKGRIIAEISQDQLRNKDLVRSYLSV